MLSMLEVSQRAFKAFVVLLVNFPVRLLREELQLLHEPGSYVGEVIKVMGKTKVLVKVQPEGKYSAFIETPSSRCFLTVPFSSR
jgi:ATP-dependent 26S proteasome regulatory subunit